MNKIRQQHLRAFFTGAVFFYFALHYAACINRYFLEIRLGEIVATMATPADAERVLKALASPTYDEARRHLLASEVNGNRKSLASLKQLLVALTERTQDFAISEAMRWAVAALFLALLLRGYSHVYALPQESA